MRSFKKWSMRQTEMEMGKLTKKSSLELWKRLLFINCEREKHFQLFRIFLTQLPHLKSPIQCINLIDWILNTNNYRPGMYHRIWIYSFIFYIPSQKLRWKRHIWQLEILLKSLGFVIFLIEFLFFHLWNCNKSYFILIDYS